MAKMNRKLRQEVLQLWRDGNYQQLILMKDAILASYSSDEEIIRVLCLALSMPEIGQSREAVAILEERLAKQRRSDVLLKTRVEVYLLAGQCAQAAKAAGEALEVAPLDADLYSMLGTSIATGLNTPDTLEEALEAYEHAVALRPDDWELWRNLGITRWKGGHLSLAKHALETAHQLLPSNETEVRQQIERWLLELSKGKSYWQANTVG
jgi:Flp pilus assembly protein TadD